MLQGNPYAGVSVEAIRELYRELSALSLTPSWDRSSKPLTGWLRRYRLEFSLRIIRVGEEVCPALDTGTMTTDRRS